MVGRHGENTFLRVCIPLDESLDALCSSKDEECGYRTEYVEKEKLRNEDYIERIKNGNFFKKDNMINQVKLNPGEKIIGMDRGKEIVLDSSSLSNK